MIRILILLITINTGVVFSASDLFSSMSDMEQLYQHEVSIGEQMEAHLKVRVVFIFLYRVLHIYWPASDHSPFLSQLTQKKLGTLFVRPVQWLLRKVIKKEENLS